MHPMSEYACHRNLPSGLDQRRHVALACDLGLGRIGRIATLTEPWVPSSFAQFPSAVALPDVPAAAKRRSVYTGGLRTASLIAAVPQPALETQPSLTPQDCQVAAGRFARSTFGKTAPGREVP